MARFLQRRFQMIGKESCFGITNVFKNAAFLRIIVFRDTGIEFDDANVELVWDPPWNQDMISVEGKMKLGMI